MIILCSHGESTHSMAKIWVTKMKKHDESHISGLLSDKSQLLKRFLNGLIIIKIELKIELTLNFVIPLRIVFADKGHIYI